MASTYSDLKIELIGTGDQSGTWGSTTNTNLGTAIEEAITGRATANFSTDANLTLGYTDVNTTQVFRNLILNVTSGVSLTATRDLIVPTIEKQYLVENNTTGNQSIVVKTSAGTGITIPNGKKAHVYANGTNVVQASDLFPTIDINGGTIDGTTIGGASAAAGTFTTATATTGNITTVNSTTVDTTNLEVTNIKAIDGTAAASIANSTGVVSITVNPVLSGGTANGVLYLNGSKVATSGSAVTYNGTTFATSADASISGLTVGKGAGAVATNTAVGASALAANTTGSYTTAIGAGALAAQNGNVQNVAVGNDAAGKLTTGNQNTAVGISSLGWNASAATTGSYNAAFGQGALTALTSGSYNTAYGSNALASNTTASNNTAVGYQALYTNTTSASQTALGYQALYNITGAFNGGNTAIGQGAGYSQTSGYSNTYVGYNSGYSMTSGIKNTILGSFSGNQGGLDIRTANNYIVLSDGDGNPRQWIDNNGAAVFPTQGDAGYGTINLVNDDPFIRFFDNGGTSTADKKKWDVRAVGASGSETFDIRTVNDANTVFTTLFSIRHTNGAVGLSTSPATTGTGITFPATQSASSNANTLDDYERGNWTPSLTSTGAATFTYGANTGGTYIKIGRWMYLMGVMNVATKSGGSSGDSLAIVLPISAGASDVSGSGVGYHISAATCTNLTVPSGYSGFPQGGVCTPNQAAFYPYWTDGANNRILQLGDIANGFQIQFSIAVFTNT